MKTLELNQMESIEGGKFWGWSPTGTCSNCINGWQICNYKHQVFWIVDAYDYRVEEC